MSESVFTGEVMRLARRLGLLAHHCKDSRKCEGAAGFPDLIALGERGLLIAELKTENGDTSAGQDLWAWTASRSGLAIPVLRPADLDSGRIIDMMGAIR